VGARFKPASRVRVDPLGAEVRTLCLSLPETSETSSWGHPNFRAGKRTFVAIERFGDVTSIAFRLHPLEVEELERQPGFMRTPYGQGRWVSLKTRPRPSRNLVKMLILKSYKLVALKRMILKLDVTDSRPNWFNLK
jgi:predicted DNA-binding protein (MmcQ/YjbR family)